MVQHYIKTMMRKGVAARRERFFRDENAADVLDPRLMWKRRQRIRTIRLTRRRNVALGRPTDEGLEELLDDGV